MTEFDTDVLIVGAGPSGLAAATELLMRGHRVRVVEKNDRTGVQPRAKTTNVRTMTHMRRWGLAEEVRRRRPLADDFPRRVSFRYGLFDTPIHDFENAFASVPRRDEAYPEHAEFIPQYVIEGILAEHVAASPGARLEFGRRLMQFDQDAGGVTARVAARDGTAPETIRARYLIGADGGRSGVRAALGIKMAGRRDLVNFVTLILRIPGLYQADGFHHALFHWVLDPQAACIIGPMDSDDVWFWAKVAEPGTPTENLLATARRVVGPDFSPEVMTRDDWVVHELIASHYREGRVFLAGDACHLHSPFGGHGMNTGIGDAVDLGWKLAAVLEGWGSETLLDSYTRERAEVHRAVVDSATRNVASLSDHFAAPDLARPDAAGDAARAQAKKAIAELKLPEFSSLGLVLGYSYGVSAGIAAEPGQAAASDLTDYVPNARPGHLAPHAWLGDGRSLYDGFGQGFTLLRLGPAEAAAEAVLTRAADAAGVPLSVFAPEEDWLQRLYGAGYALIRPDQHVAWRGDKLIGPGFLVPLMQGEGHLETLKNTA